MTKDKISSMVSLYCQKAANHARYYNKTLDYSEESIKIIEQILDQHYHELYCNTFKRIFKKIIGKDLTESKINSIAVMLGTYVGEVMRKSIGDSCTWHIEDVFGDGDSLHIKVGNARAFPIGKVYKRIMNGSEDSICSFYAEVKQKMLEEARALAFM